MTTAPRFFATPARWRAWLERHHGTAAELWVGFHKRATGTASITWPESVDGALCFGWIDGVRRRIDEFTYMIRFTPRRSGSTWSAVNIKRVGVLQGEGLMRPAGRRAFEARTAQKSGIYAYENRHRARLAPEENRRFRANRPAWEFFRQQPAWYRTTTAWWIVTAKRPETRRRRLDTLIEDCAAGVRLKQLRRPAGPTR